MQTEGIEEETTEIIEEAFGMKGEEKGVVDKGGYGTLKTLVSIEL